MRGSIDAGPHQRDHPALGAAAHGARDVQVRGEYCARGEDEALERWEVGLDAVDQRLEILTASSGCA